MSFKIMKCIIYARVSCEKQARKDLSIPAQVRAMRDYAKKRKWRIVGIYVDEAKSGKSINRPELKKLIRQCKQDQIDVVLIHKIDRLARNVIDHATIKAILNQRGIKLASVVENIEDSITGQLIENIMASIAEFYSANLAEEIRKGVQQKLKNGGWPTKAPIGYKNIRDDNDKTFSVLDPQKASYIRQIFEAYSTGQYSLLGLSEEMYKAGFTTRFGKKFSQESMKKILNNKFYIGIMTWKGVNYQGKHEPLIIQDLFYRVQEVLKSRSAQTGEKGRYKYLLRGLVWCKSCGQKLTAERHPRGIYYRCSPSIHKKNCTEPYIPVKSLETQFEYIYENLRPPLKLLKLINLELNEIIKNRNMTAKKEIAPLKKIINENKAKQVEVADQLAARVITPEIYNSLNQQYESIVKNAQDH